MEPFLADQYYNYPAEKGNSSALKAFRAVEDARREVAEFIGCAPEEVHFLNGGNEACFAGITGAFLASKPKNHVIASPVEQTSVLNALSYIELLDAQITQVAPELSTDQWEETIYKAVEMETFLLSFALVEEVTGTILPIDDVARIARPRGLVLYSNASGAVGKAPLNFASLGVDLMSFSAHKFGGPKGVGVLVVKKGSSWERVFGASEGEQQLWGAPPVAAVVGLGEAARLARIQIEEGALHQTEVIRNYFEESLLDKIGSKNAEIISGPKRLGNTSCLSLSNIDAELIAQELARQDIVISPSVSGTSAKDFARILKFFGLSSAASRSTLRVSFGASSTQEEALAVAEAIVEQIFLLSEK